jgi:hypothetical protein
MGLFLQLTHEMSYSQVHDFADFFICVCYAVSDPAIDIGLQIDRSLFAFWLLSLLSI